jgi:hypothetical protein
MRPISGEPQNKIKPRIAGVTSGVIDLECALDGGEGSKGLGCEEVGRYHCMNLEGGRLGQCI